MFVSGLKRSHENAQQGKLINYLVSPESKHAPSECSRDSERHEVIFVFDQVPRALFDREPSC